MMVKYLFGIGIIFHLTINQCISQSILNVNGCCHNQNECSLNQLNQNGNFSWFRLHPYNQICKSEIVKMRLHLQHLSKTFEFHGISENEEPVQIKFLNDSSINVSINGETETIISHSSYCIQKESDVMAEVVICLDDVLHYRKCCPVGQGFHLNDGCVGLGHDNNDDTLFPPLKSEKMRRALLPVFSYPNPNGSSPSYISTSLGKLNVTRTPWEISLPNKIKYFDRSGQHLSHQWKFVANNYCVDQLILADQLVDHQCREQDILILWENVDSAGNNSESSVYIFTYTNIVCLGIAIVFLCATIVGFMILEKPNVHKQTMTAYVLSQLLFYILIMVIYMDHLWHILSQEWCKPVGITAHFFGLATFTWLSFINLDLWWTFRILQPQTEINWSRLACYAVFATIIPAIIIIISLVIDSNDIDGGLMCRDKSSAITAFTYPGYGKEHCFLSNSAQLYYFYYPLGILLLANLIFYSCTSYRLCSLYKKSQRPSARKHRESCQLLLKLFFVMGVVWILQVIHAFVEPNERTWYWTLVDVGSMLQSIAIFIIFICKKETLKSLRKRYPIFNGIVSSGMEKISGDKSTDGSTRLSRADGSQRKSTTIPEYPEPREIIQLP